MQIQVIQNPPENNCERDRVQVIKKPQPDINQQLSLLQLDCNFLELFLNISPPCDAKLYTLQESLGQS